MSDKIPEIPEVPEKIIEAASKEELAVFIGAGVSRLVGCIGWDKLAQNLVDSCCKDKLISYGQKEVLNQCHDHRKTITICYHVFDRNGLRKKFFDLMKQALDGDRQSQSPCLWHNRNTENGGVKMQR